MMDKAKGKMKEAGGALTGNEAKKAEGQAEQRKSDAGKEAEQKAKARQAEEEAKQAEREQDKQKRKDKGLLDNVTDPLTGR
jgi:uncharacterized protein YjbJ (UPF0337 family)